MLREADGPEESDFPEEVFFGWKGDRHWVRLKERTGQPARSPKITSATPHRSETNGIAERSVRRLKEGTSSVLLQSGLNESWWVDSMECYTYLRNVTDLLSVWKTLYERRFG